MKPYLLLISRCGLAEERYEYDTFSEAENLVMAYAGACKYKLFRHGVLISSGDGTTFNR
jgi:hypothetical protein